MTHSWDEKAVFLAALQLPPSDREEFMRGACPDDAARTRLALLLRHHADRSAEAGRPAPSHGHQLPVPELVDEFLIIDRLGEGGMGVVYLAEDTILGRRVALKLLGRHLTGSEDARARFRREARSAAALKHSAIVPVYKANFDGGFHYIASEYVDGRTLADLIKSERSRRGDLASSKETTEWQRRTAQIIAEIADALDCSHRANIIHRDVKPSNILVERSGAARLTDFGIAKHLTADAPPQQTGIIGTCYYMSPEQASISGARIDRRSDIFSLGVVMYEMLALLRPFDGNDVHDVLNSVISQDPPRLRSIDRRVPKDLETVCHKSLEKSPTARYQTAAHLAADLRCFLNGDPILARPPAMHRKMARWIRQHRARFAVSMIALFTLLSFGMAGAYVYRERAETSVLTVRSDPAGARVSIQNLDPSVSQEDQWEQAGKTLFVTRLRPGHYRLTFHGPNHESGETSVLIARPEDRVVVDVHLTDWSEDPEGMILIPAGEYTCGSADRVGASAIRQVQLSAFFIDATEVSNRSYREFVDATGHPWPLHWVKNGYQDDLADHPIVAITWEDAQAYARWAGKRLPTADEWECAMRQPDNRLQPWLGREPASFHPASVAERDRMDVASWSGGYEEYAAHSRPVNSDPELATSLGIFHAATNVQEYTDSIRFGPSTQIVIKGAAWLNSPAWLTFAVIRTLPFEAGDPPEPMRSFTTGFRCARTAQLVRE